MWRNRSFVVFLVVLGGAAAFVWLTARGLPDVVASHFGASGAANGFMPRAAYLRFMLALVVVPPAAVVVLPALLLNRSNARINLPHREYWLAPDRRVCRRRGLSAAWWFSWPPSWGGPGGSSGAFVGFPGKSSLSGA